MDSWWIRSLSLLGKIVKSKYAIYYFFIFISVEILFHSIDKKISNLSEKGIEAILRNDLNMNSYFQLSRTLSDLEQVGFLKCSNLLNETNAELVLYNTIDKNECNLSSLKLVKLGSVSGNSWILRYQEGNFWLIQIVHFLVQFSILFVSGLFFYRIKSKEDIQLLEIKNQNILSNIAHQVSHDIRSPLTALLMVSKNIPEVSDDKRELIQSATSRINEIANDLLKKSKESKLESNMIKKENVTDSPILSSVAENEETDLVRLIKSLYNEKKIEHSLKTNLEIQLILDEIDTCNFHLNKKEFSRIIQI